MNDYSINIIQSLKLILPDFLDLLDRLIFLQVLVIHVGKVLRFRGKLTDGLS